VYEDVNRNGGREPNELGVADMLVFVDRNGNTKLDPHESWGVTNAGGLYALPGSEHDRQRLRVLPSPWSGHQ
jgi:hypothetical protein